jgi:hypothetical protein
MITIKNYSSTFSVTVTEYLRPYSFKKGLFSSKFWRFKGMGLALVKTSWQMASQ